MSRTRRQPRNVTGNPTFIPKKTALAMAIGLALSSQMPSAEAAIYVVTDLDNLDPGTVGTFPYALSQANENAGDADSISFLMDLSGTLTLPDGVLISSPIFIDGSNADVTITTNNDCESSCSDLFTITSGTQVTMSGLTLDSGHSSYNQSLIEHSGSGVLTLNDCTLSNSVNRATAGNGGAINNTGGHLEILDSVINGQHATGNGGAIAITNNGQLIMRRTAISGNISDTDGGGIYLANTSTVTIENATISSNFAGSGEGGGIYYSPEDLGSGNPNSFSMSSSTLSGNAAGSGGGLYAELTGTDFANVVIDNSVFSENQAAGEMGGGLAAVTSGTDAELFMEINSGLFDDNTALHRGGAISVTGDSPTSVNITNNSIVFNTVNESSGVADSGGGGLYLSGNRMSLRAVNSTIHGNSNVGDAAAPSGGGGAYLRSGSGGFGLNADLLNVTLTGNESPLGLGGGIATAFADVNSILRIINSIVAGNDAADGADISGAALVDYSLIGTDSDATLTEATPGNSIIGTNAMPANPMLSAIADNGGIEIGVDGDVPLPTRKVRAGSPVIGAGDESALNSLQSLPATDQRGTGFARIRNGGLEMGAIEYIPVPSNNDDDDNDDDDDDDNSGGGGGGGGGSGDAALLLSLLSLLGLRRRRN